LSRRNDEEVSADPRCISFLALAPLNYEYNLTNFSLKLLYFKLERQRLIQMKTGGGESQSYMTSQANQRPTFGFEDVALPTSATSSFQTIGVTPSRGRRKEFIGQLLDPYLFGIWQLPCNQFNSYMAHWSVSLFYLSR
jgi:hypothetical protein